MKFGFDVNAPVIYVTALVSGPRAVVLARLILATGATHTCLSPLTLSAAGYDLSGVPKNSALLTGNGLVEVARVEVRSVVALAQVRDNFPIFAQSLPPSARANGVLGLDFLRGHRLTLDFRAGKLELT